MCMKYEYEIGIGNQGEGSEFADKKIYHFHNDSEARQFMNLLGVSLKEEGKEVTYFNKIKKENPYHIVNRLCESLQATLAYESLQRLYLSEEVNWNGDICTVVTIQDGDIAEDAWKEVDITGLEGVEIINAIMKAL